MRPTRIRDIAPDELIAEPLYSTFDIATSGHVPHDVFTYSQAMEVPETGRTATALDTNVPRPGGVGMPQGWTYWAFDWYAHVDNESTNLPEPIAVWAKDVVLQFEYRHKYFWRASLYDVIQRSNLPHVQMFSIPREDTVEKTIEVMEKERGFSTIRLDQLLDYKVRLEHVGKSTPDLAEYVRGRDRAPRVRISLMGLLRRCVV